MGAGLSIGFPKSIHAYFPHPEAHQLENVSSTQATMNYLQRRLGNIGLNHIDKDELQFKN